MSRDLANMDAVTHEFYESLCWSFYSFSFGVFLREFAPCPFGRWLGRTGVLCAMVVMVLFGSYSIRQCSLLATNSTTGNGKGISYEKVENQRTAAASEVSREIRTPGGSVVTVRIDADRDRPVLGTADGSRWSIDRRGFSDRSTGRGITDCRGTIGSVGRVPLVNPLLSELK